MKGEIYFTYNSQVKIGHFDVHKIKHMENDKDSKTVTVGRIPEFHGENSDAHRLFGWAIAMTMIQDGDVGINFNPRQIVVLPERYTIK